MSDCGDKRQRSKLTDFPRAFQRRLLHRLGYKPSLSAKEKADIVDRAEALVRLHGRRNK